jgi:adenylate cyclase
MRRGVDERMTAAELAAACGVSERTLHRHFRRFVGLPPLAHLRRLRLAAARAELLACEGRASVTEIAARLGFLHMGRFASDYGRRFGEPPSATLRHGRSAAAERPGADPDVPSGPHPATGCDGDGALTPYLSRQAPPLAVLPFHVAAGACRADATFAEDLAEQIAVALCRLHGLSVTVTRPGSALATRYGLAGRVSRDADRVRVVMRLFEPISGRHLWGDSYDGSLDDPFGLRDRVAAGVLHAVLPHVREAEIERAWRRDPDALDAHDIVLRALPLVLAATRATTERALGLLDRAMEMDPDHAPAAALAAWCHMMLFRVQTGSGQVTASPSSADAKARALRLAERAGALGPADPLTLTALGGVAEAAGDLERASSLLARAVAMDPTFAWARERSGWLRNALGEPEIAISHFERSLRHAGPHTSSHSAAGIGCAHFIAGRHGDAARWLRKQLLANPAATWVNRQLAATHALLGDRPGALTALGAMRRAYPDATVSSIAAVLPPIAACRARTAETLAGLGLPL